jgi:hypothetical protein
MTMRRLSVDELFPGGCLEPIGDATLDLRLTEAERRTLARQSDAGYHAAVSEELLQHPEAA